MIKKIISGALGCGLLLAATAPAFAAINIANTGQNSVVNAKYDRIKSLLHSITNSYTLHQATNLTQNSGANTADNNTKDGFAAAGNVTLNGTSNVDANTTNLDVDLTSDNATCNCDITVNMTGQNSVVNATFNTSANATINVNNSGTVNNTYNAVVNTGGNSANNNTGNGTAFGGDSSVWTVITTKLNYYTAKIKM